MTRRSALTAARVVETLIGAPAGSVRLTGQLGGKHPADGLTGQVAVGDGAVMTVINPRSFEYGGLEWRLRYGNAEGVKYTAASVVECYDYLCSPNITLKEATRRLRLLRAGRAALEGPAQDTAVTRDGQT